MERIELQPARSDVVAGGGVAPLSKGLHVLFGDPSARARSRELGQVDTVFLCQPTGKRRGFDSRPPAFCAFWFCAVRGSVGSLGLRLWGRRGGGSATTRRSGVAAAGIAFPFQRSSLLRVCGNHRDRFAQADALSFGHDDPGEDTGRVRFEFHVCFVSLDFGDDVTAFDLITFLLEPSSNVPESMVSLRRGITTSVATILLPTVCPPSYGLHSMTTSSCGKAAASSDCAYGKGTSAPVTRSNGMIQKVEGEFLNLCCDLRAGAVLAPTFVYDHGTICFPDGCQHRLHVEGSQTAQIDDFGADPFVGQGVRLLARRH